MKIISLLSLLLITGLMQAKIKVVAHYNFGKAGNITYASAPNKIAPAKGTHELQIMGKPVFYADAPASKAAKGEGSILFQGGEDGYIAQHAFGEAKDNMLLEVWVKPRTLDNGDQHQGRIFTVVANGNGKEGYSIAQRGKQWVLVSGGTQIVNLGEVLKGQWTHIAAVVQDGKGSGWINGKQTATFGVTKGIAPVFTIANNSDAKGGFNGEVHEVRYSTFNTGKFNPESDFLLDYKRIKKQTAERVNTQKSLVKSIELPGLGKELVASFTGKTQQKDWLIEQVNDPCKLYVKRSEDGLTSSFQLNNGLINRTFYVADNIACVSYKNSSNDAEYLRAIKPEARICVDSVWYEVGGLKGQPEMSYLLDEWYADLETSENAFTLSKIETGVPSMRYPWTQKFNAVETEWPAKGLKLTMTYVPTDAMEDVKHLSVKIHYEIYQGIPVMTKWMEVENAGEKQVLLNEMECEVLAINQDQVKRIHVESDFSFALVNADIKGSALMHYAGTPKPYHVGSSTTHWAVDKDYNTWATHNQAEDKFLGFLHHNLLLSRLPMGPNTLVSREKPFKSFVTFELLQDSDDIERRTLGHRRMYKKLAPQTTESLLSGAITSHDEKKLKNFIDQMAELGFERLDIHPWPGISHDNLKDDYVSHWKKIADYARERNIVMGGYELQIASRGRGEEVNCVDPVTGKPGSLFGQSVCAASDWKDSYFSDMWKFFDKTGFMTYNMDGPYHGDPCASTTHPYHTGLEDSQWQQWSSQVEVIHELQRRGMYVPIPDWYFLNGQSSTGMGYREATANLTPQQQMLLGRQYIYDGTWYKLPTMGWMTLQLVGFYSNDPRVGLEPLHENLDRYESQLIQYLASGCQLSVRGNRLYDTPETKQMLEKWIGWFKEYRDILTSEIIHVSRPSGRDLDCIMHVNPFIKHKGMVVVFNPTGKEIEKTMKLPLYYTGLKDKATLVFSDGSKKVYNLTEKEELLITVKLKPQGTTWFSIEE